jgi:putative ABC transport system ATP-binding protein
LIQDPRLLLLDEPSAHLDDAGVRDMAAIVSGLAGEGKAVIVATHDPRVISALGACRVLDLVEGRLGPAALGEPGAGGAAQ